jgi:hypothetical protein
MKISELRQLIKEELLTEGYTNYWEQSEDFTSSEWSKIVRLAKATIKTAEKHGIVIRDGWGKGRAVVNNKEIYLNGDAENNLDHETFLITKTKRPWGFTKTARKPYDAVVATILVGIKKIAPKKFKPRADGSLRVGGINKWSNEY